MVQEYIRDNMNHSSLTFKVTKVFNNLGNYKSQVSYLALTDHNSLAGFHKVDLEWPSAAAATGTTSAETGWKVACHHVTVNMVDRYQPIYIYV